jgi:Leucine-rich repeat (LRR) protein
MAEGAITQSFFATIGPDLMLEMQSCLDMRSIKNLKCASNELNASVKKLSKMADSIWFGKQDTITLSELRQRHKESKSHKRTKLDLSNSNITDTELQSIVARFSNIKEINADYCHELTDRGLAHLQGLRQLTKLNLGYTDITGAGLAHLKKLKQLTSLSLRKTEISDAGLVHLQGLHQLINLNLEDAEITPEGLVS